MPMLLTKALRWGNSYALRITKRDFERLGLHVGQDVKVDLVDEDQPVALTWTTFRGGKHGARDHDKDLYGWHSDA